MPSITSRNPMPFLRRHGIRPTPRISCPILDFNALKVDTIPLLREQLDPNLMLKAAGDPPPDHGQIDTWPPPQEVTD